MRLLVCAAIAALGVLSAGCAPETPDYQSIWTTTTTSTTAPPTGRPVPFSQYLESIGVSGQQVAPDTLTDLTVSMPTPPGWSTFSSPSISPQTEMIAKNNSYPNAMLMVFKLNGQFDPAEVVKHGNADAALSENFKQLDASTADFHGFPSSMIQGSYDLNGQRLHSFNRMLIATGPPPANQRYLVQLSITSRANQAYAEDPGVEEIIAGFTVAAK